MSKDKIYFDCIRHVDDVTPINGFITRPDYMGVYYSSYTEVNENGNIVDDQYESQRYTHKAKLYFSHKLSMSLDKTEYPCSSNEVMV